MNRRNKIIFLFLFGAVNCTAQNTTLSLTSKMFEVHQQIPLAKLQGWIFKAGHDITWANEKINTTDWNNLQPTAITKKYSDKSGKVEGWFRLKFTLDSTLATTPLGLKTGTWAAVDLYLNGRFVQSFGNTGANGNKYVEYNSYSKLATPFLLNAGKEYLLAIHFVDYAAGVPFFELKGETNEHGFNDFVILTGPAYNLFYSKKIKDRSTDVVNYLVVTLFIYLFFILVTLQNPKEKILRYFTLILTMLFSVTIFSFLLSNPNLPFFYYNIYFIIRDMMSWLWPCICLVIMSVIFKKKILGILPILVSVFIVIAIVAGFISRQLFTYRPLYAAFMGLAFIVFSFYIFISSLRSIKGAKWVMMTTALLTSAAPILWAFFPTYERLGDYLFYLSLPIALVVYITQRFKEIFIEVQKNARDVLRLSEEKKDLLSAQNETLEKQVVERTSELHQSLVELKSTQSQLIQSEKMASLGELTAGIAHEIQNPLNFVNNFSEVNKELLVEMKDEINKGNITEATALANDIIENEERINQHGKRADAIVKGMLQHSRTTTGVKEPTDINKLADEYLRLAYNGLRAKDKSFNVTIKTDFDETIGKINIIPQDIGRVLLNVINNAFYAVDEKRKQKGNGYEPTVIVSTSCSLSFGESRGEVKIKVSDNGGGIPQKVLDKIFQPFFTTKPTGQGTGLGLSLSYDIVKAHGGELKVETRPARAGSDREGEETTFIITL